MTLVEQLGGLADIGAGAILAVGLWLIMTGRLVPRATLDDVRADRDSRLAEIRAETDAWRTAAETSLRQVTELMEQGRTTVALLEAIPKGGGDG